eukprot:gene3153-2135_t
MVIVLSVDWSFNYTGLLTIVYESVALLVIVQASMLTCMVLRMLFSEVSSGLLLVFGFSFSCGIAFVCIISGEITFGLSDERCLGCGRTVSLVVACDVFLRMLGVSSGCLCDG